MNDLPICQTCAVQHAHRSAVCAICADERQWVPAEGQQWTSLEELSAAGHAIELRELEPGLVGIGVAPSVGIGQRSLLVRTSQGNVLWDPTGFVDTAGFNAVTELGGIAAIAVSHPHFYGSMVEWANAFGAPLWLPEADREWVVRDDADIRWWAETAEPVPGLRLTQCGGHFDGSAVLHWPGGADGGGAVFVGDTATVCPDRRHLAFMRSYPNHIPLPRHDVERIASALSAHPFDRVYGGWWGRVISSDARAALDRSVARHLRWIGAEAVGERR